MWNYLILYFTVSNLEHENYCKTNGLSLLIGFHILYPNLEQWLSVEHGHLVQILNDLMEVEKYLESTFKQLFFPLL